MDIVKRLQGKGHLKEADSLNEKLSKLMKQYFKFKNKTCDVLHGETAEFYMMLIQFLQNYLDLSRSIRTGDYDLYIFTLPKLCNLFFATNHRNYAP